MKGALTYGRVSPIFLIWILSSVHEFASHDCLLFYLYGQFKRIEPSSPTTVSLRSTEGFETNWTKQNEQVSAQPSAPRLDMHTSTLLTILLVSSVSARFLPVWFLDHPRISVSNPDNPAVIRGIEESNIIHIIEEGLL
jgi:hypothetical protein